MKIALQLQDQLKKCWNRPNVDKSYSVKVRIKYKPDGSLTEEPTVVSPQMGADYQAYAEAAIRAIKRCQPVQINGASYEWWKHIEFVFIDAP